MLKWFEVSAGGEDCFDTTCDQCACDIPGTDDCVVEKEETGADVRYFCMKCGLTFVHPTEELLNA